MTRRLRVGVDIGGTFTDLVVMDPGAGTTVTHKVLSTPHDPSVAMLHGIDDLGVAEEIDYLVHGTTVGLNALLSGAGDRIALVTTAGFKDVLLLGRAGNPDIWSLRVQRTTPLVAPDDITTVRERIRYDGAIETPLDAADVAALTAWLQHEGILTVAVCLLHAHRNPMHELAIRDALLTELPDRAVVLSHEVSPEQGEYERTSTTVATAYVARPIERYLAALVRELDARACHAPLRVMRSSGGVCSADLVARQPIQTILSGPSGGVVAAQTLARALGRPNVIGFDMGGTSTDVSLIIDGQASMSSEGEIAGHTMRMPVVDLHTIGAGGGSIARAEAGGLRVGPRSAGAEPGPAAYGLGGELPTVTDAQVQLGRLDPDWFLGGRMKLDTEAAERALAGVGDALGLSPTAAAEGVLTVANNTMANAIRTLALRRGADPRDFSLLAFGGAGPLHGVALAEELGIDEVVVPFGMGVLSAWGMLHADVRHDVSSPVVGRVDQPQVARALADAHERLLGVGRGLLDQDDVSADDHVFVASADMRYAGQEHTINVVVGADRDLLADFHTTYLDRYGHSMPGAPVELVNARMTAIGRVGVRPDVQMREPRTAEPDGVRRVRIDGKDHDARIVHRDAIDAQRVVVGPAVVQEAGSTTLVPPGWALRLGPAGALLIQRVGADEGAA